MDQIDILADDKASLLYYRTHIFIDGSRRYGGLYYYGCSLGADLHHIFHCLCHVACIYFFACLVIRGRHSDNVHIRALILMRKTDAFFHCLVEQLIQPVLLKGRLS